MCRLYCITLVKHLFGLQTATSTRCLACNLIPKQQISGRALPLKAVNILALSPNAVRTLIQHPVGTAQAPFPSNLFPRILFLSKYKGKSDIELYINPPPVPPSRHLLFQMQQPSLPKLTPNLDSAPRRAPFILFVSGDHPPLASQSTYWRASYQGPSSSAHQTCHMYIEFSKAACQSRYVMHAPARDLRQIHGPVETGALAGLDS